MNIDRKTRVGELATRYPLATRVLDRHRIDFCCGGGIPLEEACERRGVEPESILEEIERELEVSQDPPRRWDEAPLGELIDHILLTYHQPLAEELPRLEMMARKVAQVHGEKLPEVLPKIAAIVVEIRAELEQHMAKEERILFPLIREGRGSIAEGPIMCMEHEHEEAGKALSRLRELTGGYQVPEGACNTWRALWHGLAAFETALHEHIHLENNILFPRALAESPALT